MWFSIDGKSVMVSKELALAGRDQPLETATHHDVFGVELKQPLKDGQQEIMFGMGCFWGAEKKFWQTEGVICTVVGYSAGFTPNPTYEEVCSGKTGHNEVVRVAYDPSVLSLQSLLSIFWQSHNPTQGMQQGNDKGTQYRSGIYLCDEPDKAVAEQSRVVYQQDLEKAGYPQVTTEITLAGPFYYAEDYHQQYLSKNPQGYCGLGGTNVACSDL
ncbi:MAG: peptide-methionine (S)-S-oxide reductase [Moraxellaceae bacterium]|nr:MAG: peptide-methionine (S)-S-oxide reductase [Moraxellaceae bacterium]